MKLPKNCSYNLLTEYRSMFATEGHKFDETGSLHNWWKEEDKTKFVDASKCVAEMYSNFVVEDLNEKVSRSS